MNTLISKVKLSLGRFSKDQDGVTAIEYALIAALVAVVIIGGATLLGTNLNTLFANIAGKI
ncbi:MAG: Flp family type IVb pilin [Polynucleobacter sp.]|jgi:pilus assembly protein Flp/PilA